ncbi:MAG: hypothetical protein Q9165_005385 [Trypethelium subeluteriae]
MNTNIPQHRPPDQQLHNLAQGQRLPNDTRDGRSPPRQPQLNIATSNFPQQQNTAVQSNPRFSYMATPVEVQAPTFPATQRPSTIPQSPESPDESVVTQEQAPAGQYPSEKSTAQVPREQHPAYSMLPPDDSITMQNIQVDSSPYASPTSTAPQSPGPLPAKPTSPTKPSSPTGLSIDTSTTSHAPPTGLYTPHATHTPALTSPFAPPFSPNAASGPNGLTTAPHQPGQISHPNMSSSSSGTWNHSLLSVSDSATCCLGLFCPCVLYGRTSHRLALKSAKQDPTNMLGYSAVNGHCVLWALACGLQCVPTVLQRLRVRHAYKIEGSVGRDLLGSCCCGACVLVQSEVEVREREERARRLAGPAGGAYVVNERMAYVPQGAR